ncbi:MAG TPA: amino acid ABC transporter permease, partial [Chloroflexota bacterium]
PLPHPWRYVSAGIVIAFLAFIVLSFAHAQIDWSVVKQYLTTETVLIGLEHTILISFLAMVLGLLLGVIFAVMRLSANPVTSAVAWLYVWLFRGTPVLLQLLLWFNLALVWPTVTIPGIYQDRTVHIISPFIAALLGLGVNEGAYLTEVVRAGILSVDEGQWAAASTLGLSRLQTLRLIVLPQAMRVIIPPVGNESIGMLKFSSLASVISYSELLNQTQQIYFANGAVIELLIVAAIWYLAATSVLTTIQYYVERYFGRGAQRVRPRSTGERILISLLEATRRRSSESAGT